ncbi:MAG: GTPase Era [Alphaproteobacteria bacterium]|nr:GTPase Era [Alphaproteobacteria bacterium]
MTETRTRCGFVAVIGAPNAGKSTLVNALVGTKVSIVSRKVQTTRMRVRGVAMHGDAQVVLVDTPGIFKPRRRLDRAMVQAAWAGAEEADLVCLLVDAPELIESPSGLSAQDTDSIIKRLNEAGQHAILVLNKVDALARDRLLPLIEQLRARASFDEVFLVSAAKGDGTADLLSYLASRVPEGPWAYPADQAADMPMRLLAAEITRERIYDRLHEELPYATTVITEQWKQMEDGSARLEQTIYVERESQRAIVLGKGGATIKLLGQTARKEMEAQFGHKVHLFLFVKVRENWADDPMHYREIGLDLPEA